jgi:hypothetical protein
MVFFEFESRQRHAQPSHPFTSAAPRTSSTPLPALPHCSQGSPHTPSTHYCPAHPNIYAFTYVLVLYIRCPPAEKEGRNGLANQLDSVLDSFQAGEITRLKGSHLGGDHQHPQDVTDGGFLEPPDCAFTPRWARAGAQRLDGVSGDGRGSHLSEVGARGNGTHAAIRVFRCARNTSFVRGWGGGAVALDCSPRRRARGTRESVAAQPLCGTRWKDYARSPRSGNDKGSWAVAHRGGAPRTGAFACACACACAWWGMGGTRISKIATDPTTLHARRRARTVAKASASVMFRSPYPGSKI